MRTRVPQQTALTNKQRNTFQEEGYLVLDHAIAEDELADLRNEADRIIKLVLNSSLALRERNPRLDFQMVDENAAVIRKVQPVNDLSAKITRLSVDPRLVAPMADLMGDEPVLMEEKLNYKQLVDLTGSDTSALHPTHPEVSGGEFLLHHDWGYYQANGYPDSTISSAIAFDDCERKGPLRVVPGSHLWDVPLRDPGAGSGIVAEGALGSCHPRRLDLTAGCILLFHSRLVHDSEPNRSGKPRRLMIYSHYPKSHDPVGDADRRNRPHREAARAFERRYRVLLAKGVRPLFRVGAACDSKQE